jgi:tetratricopeptide (TPR) repeat protein
VENKEATKKSSGTGKKLFIIGCLAPLCLITFSCFGLALWLTFRESPPPEPPAYIKQAEPKVEKKLEEIKKKQERFKLEDKKPEYDIDQTAQALYSIEKALLEAKSFKDLTPLILQKDSDKIPPEVIELKYRFFNIYKNLLDSEDDLDDMDSIYNVATGSLLDILSSVDCMTFTVDRDQAKKVWEKRMAEADVRDRIKDRISKHQSELIDFYFDYMKVNSKYMKEWDQLCAVRDRAYLAIYEGDWNEAVKSASSAIKLAPYEKEAHILLAMALLERKGEIDTGRAKLLIDEYLKKHQGQEAPAYLLRGVIDLKSNDYNNAVIDFDQAAAYYPKQQEDLLNLLNLYKKRSFLNKSKEGRMIVNMYRGIMTGSGYFSPDFQKARIHMEKNEKDKAKKKIFDHFFRRRLQGQWDKVLADFQYSSRFLDTDLFEITSGTEGQKLNLDIDSAFFTNSVIATVHNDSPKDIHNVTLLLCVRFTDMFKGDYISFPVGETVAVLKAGESVTVGRRNITDITQEKLGSVKKFKDIIEYAAVLISDEVITWVEAKEAQHIKDKSSETVKNQKDLAKEIINMAVESMSEKNTPDKEKAQRKEMAESIANMLISAANPNSANMTPEEKKEAIKNGKKLAKNLMEMAVDSVTETAKEDKTIDPKKYPVDKIKKLIKDIMKEPIDSFPTDADKK